MKWNVAVYLRVSKEVDDLCETNSLDNQKLIIENFVNNNQDLVIKGYYIDNGYTGTNMERPALEQMMDDIHNGKINCVIVKDMSRFSRNYAWCQIYLGERFPSNNVRFISVNDNLDSLENPNYTDKLDFVLLNLVYEHYAIEASEKVTTIKRMQQKNGDYLGVSAPYGYIKDPNDGHKVLIDNYASNIVKRIFDMTLECKSRNEIVDILNNECVLPPSKYKAEIIKVTSLSTKIAEKWQPNMIREILKNEFYIGNMAQGKVRKPTRRLNKLVKVSKEDWIVVENTHEAIIDKNDFDTVQRILEFSPNMLKQDDLLLKYLKCHDCGSVFHKKKGKYNDYYYCKNYYRNKKCTKHIVIKSILEEMVLEELKKTHNVLQLNDKTLKKYIEIIYITESGEIKIAYKNK